MGQLHTFCLRVFFEGGAKELHEFVSYDFERAARALWQRLAGQGRSVDRIEQCLTHKSDGAV